MTRTMSKSRAGLILVGFIASLVIPGTSISQEVDPVNYLPNPYETVRNWGELPDGLPWGSIPALQIDPDGYSLWVMDRCRTKSWLASGVSSCAGQSFPPIVKYDTRTGERISAFGTGIFVFPHALHIDPDGNVWIAESRGASESELAQFPSAAGKGHQVVKFSPEGEVLMILGTPGTAGDPPNYLYSPLDVAVAGNGDIFVAEGDHSGNVLGRISKFSSDGSFIKSWGHTGSGPGEFSVPHGLAFDLEGRLIVADRRNNRIQVFDQEGNYLEEYKQFGRPSDVAVDHNGFLYAVDSESGRRANNGDWRKGVRIGRASDGEVLYFIPPHFIADTFIWPSGVTSYSEGAAGDAIAVDAEGNVYTGEVGVGNPIVGITKYVRRFDLTD